MGLCCYTKYIYFGLGILALYVAKKMYFRMRRQKVLERWNNTPKDVVIVHGFPAGKTVPNPSPFILKVLTYLRMAKIRYEIDVKDFVGPKGKSPWISINGEHIPDSQFIIKFLNKKFEKNLNGNYSEEQLAVATLVRVVMEEQIFWGGVMHRFVYGFNRIAEVVNIPIPLWVVKLIVGRKMIKRARAQGLGLHTKEEVLEITSDSLRAISKLLGNKKFILGDEPCEDDCGIFGMVAQCVWGSPGSEFEQAAQNGELINLKEYAIRMKERFWPDWDRCLAN